MGMDMKDAILMLAEAERMDDACPSSEAQDPQRCGNDVQYGVKQQQLLIFGLGATCLIGLVVALLMYKKCRRPEGLLSEQALERDRLEIDLNLGASAAMSTAVSEASASIDSSWSAIKPGRFDEIRQE